MSVIKPKRVAIYARVSTQNQTVANQVDELRAVAKRLNWEIAAEFADHGISSAKGRDQRPAFDELLKRANRREFDLIMVWSIDRLGRSIPDLVTFINQVQSLGLDLYIPQQAIDTTTQAGKTTFGIFAALGEYEKELTRQRIITGQKRARSRGVKIGRPTNVNDAVKASVLMLRDKGVGIREISRKLEIGIGSIYKVLRVA